VWVFASTAFFTRLWHDGPWYLRAFWISLGPALAMGGELGQALGVVPGTYDPADLVFYGVSAMLAFLLASLAVRRQVTSFVSEPADSPARKEFRRLHGLSSALNVAVLLEGLVLLAMARGLSRPER
jgi:hypothetical protein